MKNYINLLHYFVYKTHYKLHTIFNKINPFRLIHKLPFQKRKYEELGINIDSIINSAYKSKEYGLSIMVSGGSIIALIFFLILSLISTLKNLLSITISLSLVHFTGIALLAILPCYLWVFKNNIYIDYFKKYDQWPKSKMMHNGTITIIITIFIITLSLIT